MPNTATTNAYIEHALKIIRVSNGLSADVEAELRRLAVQLRKLLSGNELATLGKRDLKGLFAKADTFVVEAYARIATHQTAAAQSVIGSEATWAARLPGFETAASAAAVTQARTGLTVLGNTVAEHWEQQALSLSNRVTAQVRLGISAGQQDAAILQRIVGTTRVPGGVVEAATRQATSLVDASTQAAADAGRRATMRANGINALRYHAILDARVCPACGEREGKLWTIDGEALGHATAYMVPPLHPGCRCIFIPLKYAEGPPPEGDAKKNTFDNWLNKQPEEKQNAVLGAGRAGLWRTNKITTSDLIGQNGLTLSLTDLQRVAGGGP